MLIFIFISTYTVKYNIHKRVAFRFFLFFSIAKTQVYKLKIKLALYLKQIIIYDLIEALFHMQI